MNLKIALLQIAPGGSLRENLEKGIRACREAKKQGADIALFPEMWSNGYRIYDCPPEQWKAGAIPADDGFILAFGKLARELELAICVTFLEAWEGGPRNSLVLFDRFGEKRLTYAKVHTCDFGEERYLTPGEDFETAVLDTAKGPVIVGAMICYDREFPESARILMLKGAELILVPNACPMEINRLSQLRARAFENMTAIATCNYPASVPDCNGGSGVFDGVAYLPQMEGSRDTCILQAGEDEGIYVAALDLDQLRTYRGQEVHGNAYRHPEKYGLLTELKVEPPFIRADKRGANRGGADKRGAAQGEKAGLRKKLYLIGGAMGVGKTTVSQILKKKLDRAVLLDGDWCWDGDPFVVTEETKEMVLKNICFLLNGFLHCSAYDNIIFCWVMDQQETISRILSGLDLSRCDVKNISLVCSRKALEERLGPDIEKGIRQPDILERSLERLGRYEGLDTVKIDVSRLSPEGAAEVIMGEGLLLDAKQPRYNAETEAAVHEARTIMNGQTSVKTYRSAGDLFREIDSETDNE